MTLGLDRGIDQVPRKRNFPCLRDCCLLLLLPPHIYLHCRHGPLASRSPNESVVLPRSYIYYYEDETGDIHTPWHVACDPRSPAIPHAGTSPQTAFDDVAADRKNEKPRPHQPRIRTPHVNRPLPLEPARPHTHRAILVHAPPSFAQPHPTCSLAFGLVMDSAPARCIPSSCRHLRAKEPTTGRSHLRAEGMNEATPHDPAKEEMGVAVHASPEGSGATNGPRPIATAEKVGSGFRLRQQHQFVADAYSQLHFDSPSILHGFLLI